MSNALMRLFPLVLFALSCLATLSSQPPGARSWADFLGTWKGVCADGKVFVVVTLSQGSGDTLTGSIRLANMRGGEDGQCATVIDPPSDKHALTVTDATRNGSTLTFRGSKRTEFEMSVQSPDLARLKFIGTPSEDNPWPLRRAQ